MVVVEGGGVGGGVVAFLHPCARGHARVWGRKHRKIHCLEDFPPPPGPPSRGGLPGDPGPPDPLCQGGVPPRHREEWGWGGWVGWCGVWRSVKQDEGVEWGGEL